MFCLLSVRCDLCVCVDDAETGGGGGVGVRNNEILVSEMNCAAHERSGL